MPLARIISRSATGCRELAIDLLARGYAVEIVEPDKIPDNFADLELRVEPPAPKIVAANAFQDNEGPVSLDFVQHLKDPMPTFMRRPPTRDDLIAAGIITGPGPKVVAEIKSQPKVIAEINPQQKAVGETVRLVSSANPMPPAATVIPGPVLKVVEQIKSPMADLKPADDTATPYLRPISKQEIPQMTAPERVIVPAFTPAPVITPGQEKTKRPRVGITITIHRSQLKASAKRLASSTFMRSNGAFMRASAGFAATVALGGVLLMGVRGSDPLVETAVANPKNDDVNSVLLPRAELHPGMASPPQNSKPVSQSKQGTAQSSVMPKPRSPGGKTKAVTALASDLKPQAPIVQRDKPAKKIVAVQKHTAHHGDSLIAKDTVTYVRK